MKYSALTLLTLCLLITACKNNTAHTAPVTVAAADSLPPKESTADSLAAQSFFPVPDYIGGQLKIIDSLKLPLTIVRKKTNTKDKTAKISMLDLRTLALNFQQPDISEPGLKKFYTKTNIADQSIPSVTLIYSTADTSLPVQKINVFIKPDPIVNDKVTGIYIEKLFSRNDTVYNQKLFWQTDKDMQIITEQRLKGHALGTQQVKVVFGH